MKQDPPPTHLDVKAFAQSAGQTNGMDMLLNYDRLMQETSRLGGERLLKWSARGEYRSEGGMAVEVWLRLQVEVSLPLTCQRCLGPVDIEVSIDRSFRFVEGEEAADTQDEDAEEDVLALSKDFNLFDLIEDEVLMTLPVVPAHDVCPVDLKLSATDSGFEAALTEKRNPFAVLAKLQNGKLK
jgi:uncharacterized protein